MRANGFARQQSAQSIRLIRPLSRRNTPSWPPCLSKSVSRSSHVPRNSPQSSQTIRSVRAGVGRNPQPYCQAIRAFQLVVKILFGHRRQQECTGNVAPATSLAPAQDACIHYMPSLVGGQPDWAVGGMLSEVTSPRSSFLMALSASSSSRPESGIPSTMPNNSSRPRMFPGPRRFRRKWHRVVQRPSTRKASPTVQADRPEPGTLIRRFLWRLPGRMRDDGIARDRTLIGVFSLKVHVRVVR